MRDCILLHLNRSCHIFYTNLFKLFRLQNSECRLPSPATTTTTTFVKRNVFSDRSRCRGLAANCETTSIKFLSAIKSNPFSRSFRLTCSSQRILDINNNMHFVPFQQIVCGLHSNLINKKTGRVLQHFYRNKHRSSKARGTSSSNEEEESDESSDEESTDDLNTYEDLAGAPNNFSVVKVHSKALRSDAIASLGLNIARNKIDELFYNSKLRLNGEKLLKKSQQMDVGDYVDVITDSREERSTVKRVQLIKVESQRTRSDKLNVHVRVWKQGFQIDKHDNDGV